MSATLYVGHVAHETTEVGLQSVFETVVVARRSRSMIRNFLAGSVMERLLRNPVRCAVLAVATSRQREKA